MSIGKMKKHREMVRHPVLRRHLPETHWITATRASQMMKTHSKIFIKPNHGSGGSGIIRIKRRSSGYEIRCGRKRRIVSGIPSLKEIRSYFKSTDRYLVQKGLHLARYKGSIFDVRVYLQRPKSTWLISGITARVAARHEYVTNFHKGGYGKPLHLVLASLFSNDQRKVDQYLTEIKELSILVAKTINKYHSIRELGIDFGIDKSGRIWIIEANSKPGHMLFSQLPDKSMLRTIMRNKRKITESKRA